MKIIVLSHLLRLTLCVVYLHQADACYTALKPWDSVNCIEIKLMFYLLRVDWEIVHQFYISELRVSCEILAPNLIYLHQTDICYTICER